MSGVLILVENGKEASEGVVGVALRDFEVGNGGKAQSCEIGRFEEGTGAGNGVVTLRDSIWNGDLRSLVGITGDALRELLAVVGDRNGGGGMLEWRKESTLHTKVSV